MYELLLNIHELLILNFQQLQYVFITLSPLLPLTCGMLVASSNIFKSTYFPAYSVICTLCDMADKLV